MELISILMPAYNAEKFIEAAINSVLKQTYTNWELLIIDDGSTDESKNIAEVFSANDVRIKVITQENKKQGAARNTGIRNAKGGWIAFLDADDLWLPEKLQKQIFASSQFPTASVIYTDGWIFNGNDLINVLPYPTTCGKLISHDDIYRMQYQSNYIPILSVLARRSMVDKIGFQNESKMFQGCEDWDYWIRMAAAGADFYGMPEKLFYYRRHDNNMSANSVNMLLAQTLVFIKNYQKEYFTEKQASLMFKSMIFPLVKDLLKQKRVDDASFILNEIEEKMPLYLYRFSKNIISLLNENAFIPVAIIWKLEKTKDFFFKGF